MNLVTKIAGVTFTNSDGEERQEIIKEIEKSIWGGGLKTFKLVREPENQYDPNAIMVLYGEKEDWKCVGYIPKELAADLCDSVDKVRALALHETGKYLNKYFLSLKMVVLEDQKKG